MHQRCNEIIAERDQAAYKRSQPVKPIDVTVMLVMHRRDKRDPSYIPLARARAARTRDEAGITASKTLHIFRLGLKLGTIVYCRPALGFSIGKVSALLVS